MNQRHRVSARTWSLAAGVLLLSCGMSPSKSSAIHSKASLGPATSSSTTGKHYQNAIYLPHGYFCTNVSDVDIASIVNQLATLHFTYHLDNLAAFNSDGTMAAKNYSTANHWNQIAHTTKPDLLQIAYVSASNSLLINSTATSNMAAFCQQCVTTLGFDGIHIDVEPIREADSANYLAFVQKVRTAIGTKHLSVAFPAVAVSGSISQTYITNMSNCVDMICVMNYDTSASSSAAFINQFTNCVEQYSTAMNPNCELVPLMAAYKKSRYHNPAVENIPNGVVAIDAAINAGARVYGSGVWWWYEMTPTDQTNWTNLWTN